MERVNFRAKELLNMGIFGRKKAYTLIADDENQADLVIKNKKDVEEIIKSNKENVLTLPIKVLQNFDDVGVILKKSFNHDEIITVKEKEQQKSSKSHINPLGMVTVTLNPLTAPLTVFKMFNAIAGVSHLDKINYRLDDISRKLDRLTLRHQAGTYGEIIANINTFKEIEQQYKILNTFSPDMIIRMSIASSNIQKSIFEYNLLLDQFINRSDRVLNEKKNNRNAAMVNKMIKEEESEINFDYNLYITALKAKVTSNKVWLIHDLIMNPEYVGERLKLVEQDLQLLQNNYNKLEKIKDLNEYVKSTFEEMNWLQKKLNKKLKLDINKRENGNISIQVPESKSTKSNLIIYKEKDKVNFLQLEENIENDSEEIIEKIKD